MADEKQIQIQELTSQLVMSVEQLRAAERQVQLCKNQLQKAELVLGECDKSLEGHKMYRSLGRMFVVQNPEELKTDLKTDIARINEESSRQNEIMKNLIVKRDDVSA